MFYAVRQGWFRGVFLDKQIALQATRNHPHPKMQEFFDQKIADNYVYNIQRNTQIAYTDGSYRYRTRKAGYGVCLMNSPCSRLTGTVPLKNPTSQKAEAYAAFVALCLTKGDLEIRTDSLQLLYYSTVRMHNNKLYNAIAYVSAGRNITWTYVRGHNGHYGNECADELARRGSASTRNVVYQYRTYRDALTKAVC